MSLRLTQIEYPKGRKENPVKIVIIYTQINQKELRIRTELFQLLFPLMIFLTCLYDQDIKRSS